MMASKHNWTEIEDIRLKRLYVDYSAKQIGLMMGLSEQAITRRIVALGIQKTALTKKLKPYSVDDIAFIKDNINLIGTTAVAEKLNRTPEAIRMFCKKNNIPILRNKPWTESDLDFIKENIKLMSFDDMAKALGRTQSSVTKYANSHGYYRFN